MVEIWNWARTFSCRPRLYVEPKSIESLQLLLKEVEKNRWKVRVIGCGHSPSSLALSNDVLISMKYFNRILHLDEEKKQIHCESGILLKTLNEYLPEHHLSLPIQGSVSALTIGGTISTATHGSGIEYGTLSSYVRGIRLMKLNGEIIEVFPDDNEELFRCLTCSLGSFGIVLSVHLQLTDLFYLELNQHRMDFHQFLDHLPIYLQSSDHFRYMWYPHTDGGIAFHLKRLPPQILPPSNGFFSRFLSFMRHRIIGYHFLEFLFYVSYWFPSFVDQINRLFLKLDGKSVHRIARCDHLFNFDCLFRQYANEWAIPIEETVSCLSELESIIEKKYHVHFPVEIRFGREEFSSYLSPSYGRKTCWMNIVSYRPYQMKHSIHRTFFEEFEKICHRHGGRPHWAKEHPLKYSDLQELYPHWKTFHHYRQLFDPENLLINPSLEKVFLPH